MKLFKNRALQVLALPMILGLLVTACDPTEQSPSAEPTTQTDPAAPEPTPGTAVGDEELHIGTLNNDPIVVEDYANAEDMAAGRQTSTMTLSASSTATSTDHGVTADQLRGTDAESRYQAWVDAGAKQSEYTSYMTTGGPPPPGTVQALVGTPSASGCRKVRNGGVRGFDFQGALTTWRWHYDKSWCWGYGVVVSPSAVVYMSDVCCGWRLGVSRVSRQWYWYGYDPPPAGPPTSGHKGYRQDRMDGPCVNIILFQGCAYEYPWTWVRSHGDGTFTWDKGGGN